MSSFIFLLICEFLDVSIISDKHIDVKGVKAE